jgi:predicted phosphate transport protein (TIGR00153 family)
MGSLFRDFFPNNSLFFNLFDQAAKNNAEMAELLLTAVNSEIADERELLFKQINRMENTGDDITHKIYLHLNKIVFTPLSRSDIHALASAIDDVADSIQDASGRMYLYDIIEFVPPIKEIASLTRLASLEIEQAVNLLRSSKRTKSIFELCRKIKTCERQSDQVYYRSVAELFSDEKDPIRVIKYREILFSLETAVNKCKNVTDVLSTILINR